MATSSWGTGRRVDEILFGSAWEFDFFQAVRLLAHLYHERHPQAPAAQSEVVRFRSQNSLAFPASAVAEIEESGDGPPRMTVTFLGMTGPQGVLPAAYTEIAIDQESFGDTSFAEFLDIFNHRLIWLFYRAWEKHHFTIGYEQAHWNGAGQDEFTAHLFDLIGMGTAGLQKLMPLSQVLPRYVGLISQRPHSAECLRALLHDYFGVPVEVEQFLGKWHGLEPDELCYLGSDEPNSQLGRGAVAGDMVWTRHALLRLVFGPLAAEQFRSFLPNGKRFTEAVALIRWFLGAALEFEIQPTLRGNQVPPCQLGDDTSTGPRLGWSTWLRTEPFFTAAKDAVFSEEELIGREA